MLKDVTLGRYYDTSSVLHSLDPRTKLFCLIVCIVSAFLADTPASLACTLVFLVFAVLLSKVPVRYMTKGLKPVLFILALTAVITILFAEKGVWKAAVIVVRTTEIIIFSDILTSTTKPKALADGLEKSLSWLKVFRLPVHDFAVSVSIALRFIPVLSEEASRITDAQTARGADFRKGGPVKRAKALSAITVPLFAASFRRADDLALAMESRLYGCAEATSLHPVKYGLGDVVSHVLILAYLAAVILIRRVCA